MASSEPLLADAEKPQAPSHVRLVTDVGRCMALLNSWFPPVSVAHGLGLMTLAPFLQPVIVGPIAFLVLLPVTAKWGWLPENHGWDTKRCSFSDVCGVTVAAVSWLCVAIFSQDATLRTVAGALLATVLPMQGSMEAILLIIWSLVEWIAAGGMNMHILSILGLALLSPSALGREDVDWVYLSSTFKRGAKAGKAMFQTEEQAWPGLCQLMGTWALPTPDQAQVWERKLKAPAMGEDLILVHRCLVDTSAFREGERQSRAELYMGTRFFGVVMETNEEVLCILNLSDISGISVVDEQGLQKTTSLKVIADCVEEESRQIIIELALMEPMVLPTTTSDGDGLATLPVLKLGVSSHVAGALASALADLQGYDALPTFASEASMKSLMGPPASPRGQPAEGKSPKRRSFRSESKTPSEEVAESLRRGSAEGISRERRRNSQLRKASNSPLTRRPLRRDQKLHGPGDDEMTTILDTYIAPFSFAEEREKVLADTWGPGCLIYDLLMRQKAVEIEQGPWELSSKSKQFSDVHATEREVKMQVPLPPSFFTGSSTRVTVHYVVRTLEGEGEQPIVVESSSVSHDVPYAESFYIQKRMRLVPSGDGVSVSDAYKVVWKHSCMMSFMIEKEVEGQMEVSGSNLLAEIQSRADQLQALRQPTPQLRQFSHEADPQRVTVKMAWELQRRTTVFHSEWHTPFLPHDGDKTWRWVDQQYKKHPWMTATKVAAARCAYPPLTPPPGWIQVGLWSPVIPDGEDAPVDADGWQYAVDFFGSSEMWGHSAQGFHCRRRMWRCTFQEPGAQGDLENQVQGAA